MGTKLGRWVIAAVALWGVGCSSPSDEAPGAPVAEAVPAAVAPAAAPAPAGVQGCGGELRLLPGDRVLAAGRTVDCGHLDQLLTEGVIDHACLGAISKQGGRACIERFVAESRTRAPAHPTPSSAEPAVEP